MLQKEYLLAPDDIIHLKIEYNNRFFISCISLLRKIVCELPHAEAVVLSCLVIVKTLHNSKRILSFLETI